MNENSNPSGELRQLPPPISAEEFDARFDAGEDMSDYFDWNRAVMVQPGELSPGQKLSIVESMIDDLLETGALASASTSGLENLSVPVSSLALAQIGKEAMRRGLSREKLVQMWLEQKFAVQETTK